MCVIVSKKKKEKEKSNEDKILEIFIKVLHFIYCELLKTNY